VNVVTRRALPDCWTKHPRAEGPLKTWYRLAKAFDWRTHQDIRDQFRSADFLADNRVVFDIAGNHYRLIVRVSYTYRQVLVKIVGTHAEYDRIDPVSI